MSADAGKRFAWAEVGVRGRGVRDTFATDGILLVIEREGGPRDAVHVQVIQRCVSGLDLDAVDGEGDVVQAEGLRAGLALAEEVLGGPQEPVEAHDTEESRVLLFDAGRAVEVDEAAEDGDVCGMRAGLRVVFFLERSVESNE